MDMDEDLRRRGEGVRTMEEGRREGRLVVEVRRDMVEEEVEEATGIGTMTEERIHRRATIRDLPHRGEEEVRPDDLGVLDTRVGVAVRLHVVARLEAEEEVVVVEDGDEAIRDRATAAAAGVGARATAEVVEDGEQGNAREMRCESGVLSSQ